MFQGEELGRSSPGEQEIAGPLCPGRAGRPCCLTSGASESSRSWEGSGLSSSAYVRALPSCRKPEIRGAGPLRLLRAEPRLLKETQHPDTSWPGTPEPALLPYLPTHRAPSRQRFGFLKRQTPPGPVGKLWGLGMGVGAQRILKRVGSSSCLSIPFSLLKYKIL